MISKNLKKLTPMMVVITVILGGAVACGKPNPSTNPTTLPDKAENKKKFEDSSESEKLNTGKTNETKTENSLRITQLDNKDPLAGFKVELLDHNNKMVPLASAKATGSRMSNSKYEHKTFETTLVKSSDSESWVTTERLEPASKYIVSGIAANVDKATTSTTNVASTTPSEMFSSVHMTPMVSLEKQTFARIFPKNGVYGVGQPISIKFDLPVKNKKMFEKLITVETTPVQNGGFHWVSDSEVRWRPEKYWIPGTKISVKALINSQPAGDGVIGQFDSRTNFSIAPASKVVKVNLRKQTLKAFLNGKLVKTIPISSGKSGFTTRSGIKVIMTRERYHDMNSSSIGIDPNSSQGYDLKNVEYALRLTTSGEFFHAAPWNTGYFGRSPRSHGCTGMSNSNAAWLYNWVKIGTPVEFIGSNSKVTVSNGFGDWNVSFPNYVK